ncbi:DUF3604 domain-containing protein [Litorimonas sp. RW-G-Af-16]|uniref:DUF3604 domain-containing protein n=1 Tax=Litorimonas sp. RW-G-Af-16 TaxID=3241168 RepID=UPI00390CBA47
MRYFLGSACLLALLAGCTGADTPTQDIAAPDTTIPAAETPSARNAEKSVYFGDLHIHTKNSFDAYIFNVRTTPDDVYRFAKGESVRHPSGYDIKLGGEPLDFVAATDHGAYMGVLPQMNNPDSPLSKLEISKTMFGTDPELIVAAFNKVGGSVRSGEPFAEIYDRDLIDQTWQDAVAAADRHYEPGKLTTFAGYEYTAVSMRGGNGFEGGNLHRNVIFKDAAPKRLFATLDSTNPENLWDWMDEERKAGRDVMAIPHNSNVSDGEMFAMTQMDGSAIDAAYTQQRLRNEPIVEMTQVKGTSETHPALSPNDEFADFEIYEYLLASQTKSKINGSYIREALARGMALEKATGTNPYQFGLIGSSDTHVAGGAFDESDYWSKVGIIDGTPEMRGSVPPGGAKTWDGVKASDNAEYWFSRWGASGYAAVWAEENTREAIYAAMARKETYATSGTRIKLRFFGGNLSSDLVGATDLATQAGANGVPMGGNLAGDTAPSFIAQAMRDPRGAPLDRIQIVKVWNNEYGMQERIYDMACSDGRTANPTTHRCADNGASVDLSNCSPSTGAGAPELVGHWTDPDFDGSYQASYYVRVLENPTCRWSSWDAMRAGVERHPDRPATIKERAWSSPIWVSAAQ